MKTSPSSSSSISSNEPLPCVPTINPPPPPPNEEEEEQQPPNKPRFIRRTKRKPNQEKISAGRSSIYRGVTKHRWTGRYEAHLWDKNSWNSIQNKRGRQVYLGAYDDEVAAAHTYDLAALKYWGQDTILNFSLSTYMKEYEEMQNVSKEEYLASLRRRSSGFARGVSKYRGVARHHHNGRWEARIGRVLGNKYLYLGTYSTEEEAAAAYDLAAIEYRGVNAVTNFNINNYIKTFPPVQQFSSFTDSQEVPGTPMLSDTIDESTIIDPIHDIPWNMCLDNRFNLFPVPDVSMENSNELPDVFDDNGFEENIEYLFEGNATTSKGMGKQMEKINEIDLKGILEESGGNLSVWDLKS